MLKFTRSCNATIVGVSLLVALSGCPPKTEPMQPDAVVSKQPDVREKAQSRYENGQKLIAAAISGNVIEARSLIANGADVNAKDKDGGTALIGAAWYGWMEIAQLLIANGADVNMMNHGGTALMAASESGMTRVARLLIAFGADVNMKNEYGGTALMAAVSGRRKEVAELLIEHKADVNAKDDHVQTALMFAADDGYKEVAELLIKHGADVNAKDEYGKTVLMFAAAARNKMFVAPQTALMSYVSKEYTGIVESLVARGADVNATDNNGGTALKIAIHNEDRAMQKILRKHGAR